MQEGLDEELEDEDLTAVILLSEGERDVIAVSCCPVLRRPAQFYPGVLLVIITYYVIIDMRLMFISYPVYVVLI